MTDPFVSVLASVPAHRAILVTGGAQGLGAAVARQIAARGWAVAVADVNEAGAQAIARACGEAAFAIGVDNYCRVRHRSGSRAVDQPCTDDSR